MLRSTALVTIATLAFPGDTILARDGAHTLLAPPPIVAAPVLHRLQDPGGVTVTVRWHDGTPAVGVAVELRPDARDATLRVQIARTDIHGVVRFQPSNALFAGRDRGSVVVEADRGVRVDAGIVLARGLDVALTIPRGVDVRGTVVDLRGETVADAEIRLSGLTSFGVVVAKSDADGRFMLRGVQPGRRIGASRLGNASSEVLLVEGEPGGIDEVRLQLGGRADVIRGRVVDADGEPCAAATVFVGNVGGVGSYRRTAADGTFADSIETAGDTVPVWVGAPDRAVWHRDIERSRGQPLHVDVELSRGASASGRITDAAGSPWAGGQLRVIQPGTEPPPRVGYTGPSWGRRVARTDADGRYEVFDLQPGAVTLRASDRDRGHAVAELTVTSGARVQWDGVLGPGVAIGGTIVDGDGSPLAEWQVLCNDPDRGRQLSARTDAGGRFRIEGCEPGPHELFVLDPGYVMHDPRAEVRGVLPGTEIRIAVPLAEIPSCFLTGRVLDPAGDPVGQASVCAAWHGADGRICAVDSDSELEDGRFRIGPVIPGHFELWAHSDEYGALPLGTTDVAAGAQAEVGTHEFARPGGLWLSVRLHDGTPAEGRLRVTRIGAHASQHIALAAGQGAVEPLQPGRYRIASFGDALPLHAIEVTVAENEIRRQKINWPRGVWRTLRHPPTPRAGTFVAQIWRKQDGEVVYAEVSTFAGSERPYEFERLIPPGSYTVETRRGRHRAGAAFVVDDTPTSDKVLVVPMPASR